MTPAVRIDAAEPPEPLAELLCLVLHGREPITTPAIQKAEESLSRFGYAHTEPRALSDTEIALADLVVTRGLCVDTAYMNTPEGRVSLRGDENLEQLRRLPRER